MFVFTAQRLQLTLIAPLNKSHHRIALNEREKQTQNSGKGQIVLLEIANPLEHTTVATEAF
jgi:hypothetical protein